MTRASFALVFAFSSIAIAGPAAKKDTPKDDAATTTTKAIDVSSVADKLAAYKDDVGNYYVSPIARAFSDPHEVEKYLFYGDGKTMYQQRAIGVSLVKGGIEWSVWAPRAKEMAGAILRLVDSDMYVGCRHIKAGGGRRPITQLTGDETRTLLAKAKFLPPLWTRTSRFLARDDDANYYYVDSLTPELGGNGYRVYVGQKGAMKQMSLTNMASDSVGEIYATKEGRLKIGAKDATAVWIKGARRIELTVVPVADNRYLIYRDLGVYGSLGAICDDQ